jgi:hypothetical protein
MSKKWWNCVRMKLWVRLVDSWWEGKSEGGTSWARRETLQVSQAKEGKAWWRIQRLMERTFRGQQRKEVRKRKGGTPLPEKRKAREGEET